MEWARWNRAFEMSRGSRWSQGEWYLHLEQRVNNGQELLGEPAAARSPVLE